MGLEKAIKYGKEKRKSYEYDFAKQVDIQCRNHGTCTYCYNRRMHKNIKRLISANEQLKEYKTLGSFDKIEIQAS